jgi:hypothetical protein
MKLLMILGCVLLSDDFVSRTAAAGLLASVMPDSMSDIVDSERCFITIRNGSPPGIRRYGFLLPSHLSVFFWLMSLCALLYMKVK